MRNKRKRADIMNIGTSSMLVILIGLSFAVLAALAISSAHNDYRLSEELAAHTTAYYEASNEAQEMLAEPGGLYGARDEEGYASFDVPVGDRQKLCVEVCFGGTPEDYVITRWQVVNTDGWEGDASLPVFK